MEAAQSAENDRQPCPPEWQAWDAGTGLCPYCDGMPFEDWMAMCDCFMSVEQWENITGLKANEQPHSEEDWTPEWTI